MRCCPGDVVLILCSRGFKFKLTVPVIAVIFAAAVAFFNPWNVRVLAADPPPADQGQAVREKIDAYKRFKGRYEDKDFQIEPRPFKRTRYHHGRLEVVYHNVYTLSYGIVTDKLKNYNKKARRIVRSPIDAQVDGNLICEDGLYLERYDQTGMHPQTSCLKDTADLSDPVKLIFETLAEDEIRSIVLINEFPEGDLDIQFASEKAGDLNFVETIYQKLAVADERNDQTCPPIRMEPIIPAENQRVAISYIDLQNDDEPEFVMLSYCIDGSYFDEDPSNNAVQIGLKYKLITRNDLEGKSTLQRTDLETRLGLWMWKKPVEILISFADHPGPDIVFNDRGIVINGWVIDPAPDGEFDQFEFLF